MTLSLSNLKLLSGDLKLVGLNTSNPIQKNVRLHEDSNLYRDHYLAISKGKGSIFHSFELHLKQNWMDFFYVAFVQKNQGVDLTYFCGGKRLNGIRNHMHYLEEWQRLKERYFMSLGAKPKAIYSTNRLAYLQLQIAQDTLKLSSELKEVLSKEIHFYKIISKLARRELNWHVQDVNYLQYKEDRFQKAQATAPYRDVCLFINELVKNMKESENVYQTDYIDQFIKRSCNYYTSEFSNSTLSYKWVNSPLKYKQITCLYNLLNENYIDKKTKLEDFIKAFDGTVIASPLRIKFVKMTPKGDHTSKRSLFYLLYRLGERKLLFKEDTVFGKNMEYSKAFQERLNLVFVDHNGNSFKNIVGARIDKDGTAIDYPKDKNKIDEIVESVEAVVA